MSRHPPVLVGAPRDRGRVENHALRALPRLRLVPALKSASSCARVLWDMGSGDSGGRHPRRRGSPWPTLPGTAAPLLPAKRVRVRVPGRGVGAFCSPSGPCVPATPVDDVDDVDDVTFPIWTVGDRRLRPPRPRVKALLGEGRPVQPSTYLPT